MQRQFQQIVEFFVPSVQFVDRMVDTSVACRSWYAQCTLCSRPWRSHRYSSWDGCSRACCCAATGALIGSCRKLWSLRSCSFGCRPVPGQGCCARRCNDCGSRNSWFDCGYMLFSREAFGIFFAIFYVKRLIRLLSSIHVLLFWPAHRRQRQFHTPRATFPRFAGGLQRSVQSMLRLLAGCTWKSVHYFLRASWTFQHVQRSNFCAS